MPPPADPAAVLHALAATLHGRVTTQDAVRTMLRAHPAWDNAARASHAFAVNNIMALQERLRCACAGEVTAARMLAAWLKLERGADPDAVVRLAGLSRAELDALAYRWPDDPLQALAAQAALPAWLVEEWRDALGSADEVLRLADVLNVPGPLVLRANPLRTTREALLLTLAEAGVKARAGGFSPWAVVVDGRLNVTGTDAWRAGHYEPQDEGSQLLALWTEAAPGEQVIDHCAGSGGKTLAMAAMMRNQGVIWAADVVPQRLTDLVGRAARAGVEVVRVRAHPLPRDVVADVVLVDAPCSATGVLRRSPGARGTLVRAGVEAHAREQKRILAEAATRVGPGGRLVYATCSLVRAENLDVARAFEATQPGFAPWPLPGGAPGRHADAPHMATLWPHHHGTDGFFAARWRRTA